MRFQGFLSLPVDSTWANTPKGLKKRKVLLLKAKKKRVWEKVRPHLLKEDLYGSFKIFISSHE